MNKCTLLILFVSAFLSLSIALAQTKDIVFLDAETKTPIPNVSVKLENSQAGTISQNDGKAKVNQSTKGNLIVSHINYITQTIQTSNISEYYTIYLKPRSSREIEEIIIQAPDNRWIGRWKLKTIRRIYLDSNGKAIGHSSNSYSNNIKEYKKDRSFSITNGSRIYLIGTFTTDQSQVIEKIKYAKDNFLMGITNILTYFPDTKKENRMVVQYQLPNQTTITEEVWEKIKEKKQL